MNNKFKKVTCLLLGVTLGVSAFASCGGNEEEDLTTEDAKTIYVEMYEGGYGTEWMKEIAKDFEKAYEAEGYEVKLSASASMTYSNLENRLKAGPKINKTDLFLAGASNFNLIIDQGANYVSGYDYALADLTDLYNSPVYGEETLYKDKLIAQCVTRNEIGGKYYSTNWGGGPLGFAYNMKFFTDNGWTVPNTTNEMIALIAEIKSDGYVPFVWCGTTAAYWEYAQLPWWRQLEADDEAVERFWQCKDEDGNYSPEVFNSIARLKSCKLVEDMIYDTANSYERSMTSTHIEAQMFLYDGANKIAMMPTGDWAENEMDINGYPRENSTMGFMRVPVASDAIYLEDGSYRFETVRDDATLSAVIKAVDEGKTSYDGVSAEDFASVKKLRSYTNTMAYDHNALIPVYANAKVGAKKFLAYLASDAALQKYYDLTGCFLPYESSNVQLKADATEFQKSLHMTMKNINFVTVSDSKHKIFYGTSLNFNAGTIEARIGTTATAEKMTGTQFFNYTYNTVVDNFDTYVSLIG